LSALSGIYGRVVRARRAWYEQPHRQHHLVRPVVSIGNLVVGGSGKTPAVAAVTRILQDLGERPAILSRGYGRRSEAALVVVSDGHGPLVGVADSGDEPQMLARSLPGAVLVVGADRHKAGHWAETHLDATVHVLDDGFQHVRLARDVDLLMMSVNDLTERVLPTGRLREPVEAAEAADAVLVQGSHADRVRVQAALNARTVFEVVPTSAPLRDLHPFGGVSASGPGRVVAVAGIARPERFFAGLTASGFEIASALTFRDHHWFDQRDVQRIQDVARAAGTSLVVTTEKDAVRLEPFVAAQASGPDAVHWTYQPYQVRVEPDATFRAWLAERLAAARQRRATRSA